MDYQLSITERLSNRLVRSTNNVAAILADQEFDQKIMEKETNTMKEVIRGLEELVKVANATMLAIERGVVGRKENQEQLQTELDDLQNATILARNLSSVFMVADPEIMLEVLEVVDLPVANHALGEFRKRNPEKFGQLVELVNKLQGENDVQNPRPG